MGPFLVGMPGLEVREEVMLQLEVQQTDPAPETGVLKKYLRKIYFFYYDIIIIICQKKKIQCRL